MRHLSAIHIYPALSPKRNQPHFREKLSNDVPSYDFERLKSSMLQNDHMVSLNSVLGLELYARRICSPTSSFEVSNDVGTGDKFAYRALHFGSKPNRNNVTKWG